MKQKCKDFEFFLNEAVKVHGDKYIYHKETYDSNRSFIEITCKRHQHRFRQRDFAHLRGQNCPLCGKEAALETRRINKQNQFISKIHTKYPNKFNTDKVNYLDVNSPVIVECDVHGEIEVNPRTLLRHGCTLCNKESKIKKYTHNFWGKIEKCDTYSHIDFSEVKYYNNTTKVKLICKLHNKIFYATPNRILDSKGIRGCDLCVQASSNRWTIKAIRSSPTSGNEKAYLYIGTANKVKGYKIGITKNLDHRKSIYQKDMEGTDLKFDYLYTFKTSLLCASVIESLIKSTYKNYHIRHGFDFGGKTEFYELPDFRMVEDILSGRFDLEFHYLSQECSRVSDEVFKSFVRFLKVKYKIR